MILIRFVVKGLWNLGSCLVLFGDIGLEGKAHAEHIALRAGKMVFEVAYIQGGS